MGTLNGALSTPSYLLALLRELSQCPRALPEIKGGPEPLEKEIHEILGSKCEDEVLTSALSRSFC